MMSSLLLTPLATRLCPYFSLSKSRLMTLCVMIVGLVNGRPHPPHNKEPRKVLLCLNAFRVGL